MAGRCVCEGEDNPEKHEERRFSEGRDAEPPDHTA
jgi:hypothetical protein